MDGPRLRPLAERIDGGETVDAMAGWAREHGINLIGGSIAIAADDEPSTTSRSRSTGAETSRRLHEDPPLRRGRRRVQLPGVRRHRARIRPRHRGARRHHGRPHRLLRPALPGALPGARARPRRADPHDPVELHAPHRHGPLGGAPARAGDREPGLRARHRPARDAGRARQAELRPLDDRRPVGRPCWRRRPTAMG